MRRVLVLAIGITALPRVMAAESPRRLRRKQLAKPVRKRWGKYLQAVFETFTDETLVTPYEYDPYGDLTVLSGCTAEELEALLAGSGLEGLGTCYAEKGTDARYQRAF